MIDTNQLFQILAQGGASAPSGFLSTLNVWHVVALLLGGVLLHVYHSVVNAGGYVMIWRRFKYGPTGRASGPGVGATGAAGAAARFVPQTSRMMAAGPAVLGRPMGSVSGPGKLVPSATSKGHLTRDLAVGQNAERGNVEGAVGFANASVVSPILGAVGNAGAAVASPGLGAAVKVGVVLMAVWFAMVMRTAGALTIAPLLNYQALSGTNFTGSVAISNAYVPPRTLVFQNGGLATTNTAFVEAQVSLDNTNFITLGTYTPSVTNAGIYTYAPAMNNVTVYFRARVGLTNASSVSVQSLQTP